MKTPGSMGPVLSHAPTCGLVRADRARRRADTRRTMRPPSFDLGNGVSARRVADGDGAADNAAAAP
jgi:hypothetical protein